MLRLLASDYSIVVVAVVVFGGCLNLLVLVHFVPTLAPNLVVVLVLGLLWLLLLLSLLSLLLLLLLFSYVCVGEEGEGPVLPAVVCALVIFCC